MKSKGYFFKINDFKGSISAKIRVFALIKKLFASNKLKIE